MIDITNWWLFPLGTFWGFLISSSCYAIGNHIGRKMTVEEKTKYEIVIGEYDEELNRKNRSVVMGVGMEEE